MSCVCASHPQVLGDAALHDMLSALLSAARVRTLLTATEPVSQPLQGGAEKVVELSPLSAHNAARLLCRLSPRPLRLSEIDGAESGADFVRKLAAHPLICELHGNARRIKAAALHLQHVQLAELLQLVRDREAQERARGSEGASEGGD